MKLFLLLCFLGVFKIKGGSSTPQTDGSQSSWVSDENLLWPTDRRIVYYIDPNFNETERRQIKQAVEELSRSLYPDCLSFLELRGGIPIESEYMHFIQLHSDTCKSDLGMQRAKPTKISLGPKCFAPGVILHELVHALGAAHEQTRPDRDFYVSINWDNIKNESEHNFKINEKYNMTSQTPYDYLSITHYPGSAHARNESLSTISSRFDLGKVALGYENTKLSATDKIEISEVYNCQVDKSMEKDYLEYIDELFTEVMEKFWICIENSTRPDEDCKAFSQISKYMLAETRRVSPRNMYHHHNIEFRVALNRLNQRRMEWNTAIELNGIKSKSIVSATRLHKELIQTRKKNVKLQQDLDKQAEHFEQKLRENNEKLQQELDKQAENDQKLRNENKMLKGNMTEHTELLNNLLRYFNVDQSLLSKPWFGEPGVLIYGNKGYQVVEWKSPYCNKFPGGTNSGGTDCKLNRASINSQAEFDFITDLLGDREAYLGGEVRNSDDSPPFSTFFWWDNSTTTFFHTLEKKRKGFGVAARIKSGEIYIGGSPRPNLIVCEYP